MEPFVNGGGKGIPVIFLYLNRTTLFTYGSRTSFYSNQILSILSKLLSIRWGPTKKI